jgi:hypothetical protein
MLPGFRFLFGAIVLSMSVLVFGFGAAALLRTAHEEFASAPAWRPAPETRFAQNQENTQASQPVLALLRIDDAPKDTIKETIKDTLKDLDKDAAKVEPPVVSDVAVNAAAAPATAPLPQPDLDKTAALQPSDAPSSAAVAPETAPPQAEAPAATDQTKLAAVAQPSTEAPAPPTTEVAPVSEVAPLPAVEAAPAASETMTTPPAASLSTRIATLGGPPVSIRSPKAASAKPDTEKDKDAVRKRQAHRVAHRRRIAALRLQQQQATQQQLNPFGQTPVNQNPAR